MSWKGLEKRGGGYSRRPLSRPKVCRYYICWAIIFPKRGFCTLDTRFLFPETYAFKETLAQLFHLNVIILQSATSLEQQKETKSGLFQYALNPDKCCFMNKVQPLDNFLESGDVWINGVRRDQTSVRKIMNTLEENEKGMVKFHPMLEWTNKDIHYYIQHYHLP